MSNIQNMDDTTAATLILHAVAKANGKEPMTKSFFFGDKPIFDIIPRRIHGPDPYASYTFFAVKTGKVKSAPHALGELVLKDVMSKLFDHFVGDMSPVYSMAQDLSGAIEAGSGDAIDTNAIWDKAAQVGGAMQLHAAKQMGKHAYDQTRIYGLSSDVIYGGVARFKEKRSGGSSDVEIIVRGWQGLSASAPWIDRFHGHSNYNAHQDIKDLKKKWGGHFRGDYVYCPTTGLLS